MFGFKVRVFVLSMLVVALGVGALLFHSQLRVLIFGEGSGAPPVSMHQTVNGSGLKSLQVSSLSTQILVEFSAALNAEVSLDGEFPYAHQEGLELLHVERIGDALTIQVRENPDRSVFRLEFHRSEGVLKVVLPRTLKKLFLKSISGNIEIQGGTLEKVDAETTSGDFDLTDARVSDLAWRTTSGSLDAAGEFSQAKAKSVSGDFKFAFDNLAPFLKAQSISGSATFEFQAEPDIHLEFSTVSGSFTCSDLFTSCRSNQTETKHFTEELGSAEGAIEFSTVSGDLELTRR